MPRSPLATWSANTRAALTDDTTRRENSRLISIVAAIASADSSQITQWARSAVTCAVVKPAAAVASARVLASPAIRAIVENSCSATCSGPAPEPVAARVMALSAALKARSIDWRSSPASAEPAALASAANPPVRSTSLSRRWLSKARSVATPAGSIDPMTDTNRCRCALDCAASARTACSEVTEAACTCWAAMAWS